jgi:nucleoside-diphosphate-sugar epimerase
MGNIILIVGGAGYIGTVLSEEFLREGYEVRVLDLFLYKNNECVLNCLGQQNYTFIYGDCTDRSFMEKVLDGVGSVILLAGLVGDPITKKYPEESRLINDIGVRSVIDACARSGIGRLVFVSTCSNYGLIGSDDKAGEEHPLNPLSLYARFKVAIEEHILLLKGRVDFNSTILRFATAFGLSPRMRFDLTISEFTRELFLGRELLVYDADTWRPYCHVRDFARLIQKVIEAPASDVSFEVFNVGGDENNYTKQMIIDEILKFIPAGRVKYSEHDSDQRNYRVDFSKVRTVLGFAPAYSVPDGIKELIGAMEQHVFDRVNERRNFFGNYEIDYAPSLCLTEVTQPAG